MIRESVVPQMDVGHSLMLLHTLGVSIDHFLKLLGIFLVFFLHDIYLYISQYKNYNFKNKSLSHLHNQRDDTYTRYEKVKTTTPFSNYKTFHSFVKITILHKKIKTIPTTLCYYTVL